MNNNEYDFRIIAFMDILGFKNHIDDTTQNPEHKANIFNIMDFINTVQTENYTGPLTLVELGKEVTIFSDSIVISYPCTLPGALFYILIDIIHIQLELAAKGIILRGGITIGEVYHNKNIVFGPAMIEAYELESKYALYPRIIIEKEIIDWSLNNLPLVNPLKFEKQYIYNLLTQDTDGYLFTNFLAQSQELDSPDNYYLILQKLNQIITSMAQNIEIQNKYIWLKNYYNQFTYNKPDLFIK